MAETSTIFGFMKYVSATDILSDFKKTVDSYFVNSLKQGNDPCFFFVYKKSAQLSTFIVIIYRIYCRDFFDQTKHSLLCCLWKYLFLEY